MRKLGHIFFILFCLLIVSASDIVPKAYAASSMTPSESCVNFIKEIEGFSPHPYYDYNQHTVGYGTACPTEKYFDYMVNGIPEKEADALLREVLANVGDAINQKLINRYGLTFTQHQFDALVSFSFNVGTGWMTYDSTLRNALFRNANNDDLVYAFSLYCTAGGAYSYGLIARRLCEANMFLNGIYSQHINDAFGYVFYEPNGGSLTYRVQGFICENNSVPVADAIRNGDVFLGWYTELTGGSRVTELNRSVTGKTLFARWQSSQNSENQDSPSTMIQVTGDVVNIRKGPGTNYGISTQVYRNNVLLVSHVTSLSGRKWGKVQNGWICLDYTNYDAVINGTGNTDSENNDHSSGEITVPDAPPPTDDAQTNVNQSTGSQPIKSGIVQVGDLLRIRNGPGITYSTVGYLSDGHKVEILEQTIVGTMVWGRTARGWVSMDYIKTDDVTPGTTTKPEHNQETLPDQTPAESTPKPEITAIQGKIIADALRIRTGPNTSYKIAGFYYQNDVVTITEKLLVDSVYWGKTNRGWINLDYFQPVSSEETPLPAPDGEVKTVIADCLRVRKRTGTDSPIAALLYFGDTVTVLETKTVDGILWGKVDKGWICMDYVQ